ncbi:hypothetical protein [Micromonospora trifolii]|uniref:hypothetical protein n=1 Tax=Micromonospora trifolii TaxID=2911208 RepID=UPI003CF32A52
MTISIPPPVATPPGNNVGTRKQILAQIGMGVDSSVRHCDDHAGPLTQFVYLLDSQKWQVPLVASYEVRILGWGGKAGRKQGSDQS